MVSTSRADRRRRVAGRLRCRCKRAEVPVGPPITPVSGQTFTVGNTLAVTDQHGRSANVTVTDVLTSNGVILPHP